jgi:uncharacterized protein
MTIVQQGSINTNALSVPDLYVQIVPPQPQLNGVPTNILGIVGTATWGPVNSPTIASSPSDTSRQFGPIQARKFDLGTAVYTSSLQGASNFRLIRATDGTDTAASASLNQAGAASAVVATGGTSGYAVNDTITLVGGTFTAAAVLTVTSVDGSGRVTGVSITTPGSYSVLPTNPVSKGTTSGSGVGTPTFTLSFACITFTGKYTGSLGNSLSVNVGTGTNNTSGSPTYKLTVNLPGQLSEVYDNIGGTGNTLYINMVAAINNGQSGLRGPSQLVVASLGAGTAAPTSPSSITLAGGTDGATTITSTVLIGQDTTPRKGMYALRGTGASVAMLADADDSTQWTLQVAYGLSEGTYMVATSPAGDTISNFGSTLATAGIDSYDLKAVFGDWCYITDTVNGGITRLVSPQGFVAGKLSALSPEQSSLNKQLQGIIATQKTYQNQQYSSADLQAIAAARGEVIANPSPGGSYFSPRLGINSSSNAAINGDNYPRLTNFIAATLNAGMGIYIGQVQSPTVQASAKATLDNFLQNMFQQRMIQAWKVILDGTNNPQSRVSLGYMQADVMVQYLSIIRYFLINLQSGQTVVISSNTPSAAFQ